MLPFELSTNNFVNCHFPIRSANVQFELQTVSSKPNWVFQFEVQTSTKLLIKKNISFNHGICFSVAADMTFIRTIYYMEMEKMV